jgi:SAM-dependent methyltransferase
MERHLNENRSGKAANSVSSDKSQGIGPQDKDLDTFLQRCANEQMLYSGVLSDPIKKSSGSKITVRPIDTKQGKAFQFSEQCGEKVFHRTVPLENAVQELLQAFREGFKQALICTADVDLQILRNSKGRETIIKKPPSKKSPLSLHNRQKNYLLQEGVVHPFLVELGVMDSLGKVVPKKADKFRQINRFLEFIEDIVDELPKKEVINIVDFGCGKSYLTFALYEHLKNNCKLPVRVIGLDLKSDVIETCSKLARKLNYRDLTFQKGDINDILPEGDVDMMISLHACDTATDAALEKAVRWGAKDIMAVPCCQNELYHQVSQPKLTSLFRHGIVKERVAALITDAARADLLEMKGYRCQIIEFIDLEHTPKNLLLRAVRTGDAKSIEAATKRYQALTELLGITPCLERLLAREP